MKNNNINPSSDDIKNSVVFSETYLLSKIDQIIDANEYLKEGIQSINEMEINTSLNGGMGDQARAEAIGTMVQCRETTNQQIIKLLEKMYDDMKASKQINC